MMYSRLIRKSSTRFKMPHFFLQTSYSSEREKANKVLKIIFFPGINTLRWRKSDHPATLNNSLCRGTLIS
jgi:hypothetical protein